jgi:hypothetical protein
MTVAELRDLIGEVVEERLSALLGDPDEGLQLRPEVVERLHEQIASVERGERGVPAEDVFGRLDL